MNVEAVRLRTFACTVQYQTTDLFKSRHSDKIWSVANMELIISYPFALSYTRLYKPCNGYDFMSSMLLICNAFDFAFSFPMFISKGLYWYFWKMYHAQYNYSIATQNILNWVFPISESEFPILTLSREWWIICYQKIWNVHQHNCQSYIFSFNLSWVNLSMFNINLPQYPAMTGCIRGGGVLTLKRGTGTCGP